LKNALPLAKHLNVLIAVRYKSSQIKQPLIVKVKNDTGRIAGTNYERTGTPHGSAIVKIYLVSYQVSGMTAQSRKVLV